MLNHGHPSNATSYLSAPVTDGNETDEDVPVSVGIVRRPADTWNVLIITYFPLTLLVNSDKSLFVCSIATTKTNLSELNSKLEWKPFTLSVSGSANLLVIQECVANACEADVYIYYRRTKWQIPNDTWEIIAGIPEGYRPKTDCPVQIYDNLTNCIGIGMAHPNGIIRFKMLTGVYTVNGESTFKFHYAI